MHYVIRYPNGDFQYPRRRTGRYMYECRSTRGPNMGEARIYNNKTAAMNSMWFSDGQVVEVQLGLVEA